MASGSVTASVTTQSNCAWSVSPDASWLGVTGSGSRTGSGSITITYADNYAPPRQGIVKVRWDAPTQGQNIIVSQAGCSYSVTRSDFNFGTAGGTGTFNVLQMADPNTCGGPLQDRCVWRAVPTCPDHDHHQHASSGDDPVSFMFRRMSASGASADHRATRWSSSIVGVFPLRPQPLRDRRARMIAGGD
jgi:hypothetical protein